MSSESDEEIYQVLNMNENIEFEIEVQDGDMSQEENRQNKGPTVSDLHEYQEFKNFLEGDLKKDTDLLIYVMKNETEVLKIVQAKQTNFKYIEYFSTISKNISNSIFNSQKHAALQIEITTLYINDFDPEQ